MRGIKKVTVKCTKVSVRLCQNIMQKPNVFTSKRKAVLLFEISVQKKLNPLEPARTKALNENRMLGTVCFAVREDNSKCPFIFLDNYVEFEIFEMRYKFSIKTDLLTDTSKTRVFFWLKKPLCQISVFFLSSLWGEMIFSGQRNP